MFDWIQFNPERLLQPAVIVGLVIILVGAVLAIFSKAISDKICKSKGITDLEIATKYRIIISIIAMVVTLCGCLVAILMIK